MCLVLDYISLTTGRIEPPGKPQQVELHIYIYNIYSTRGRIYLLSNTVVPHVFASINCLYKSPYILAYSSTGLSYQFLEKAHQARFF